MYINMMVISATVALRYEGHDVECSNALWPQAT